LNKRKCGAGFSLSVDYRQVLCLTEILLDEIKSAKNLEVDSDKGFVDSKTS
jgi:hypothetical protein